jgi:hypothetical protein
MTNLENLKMWLNYKITEEVRKKENLIMGMKDPSFPTNPEKIDGFNEMIQQTEFRIDWLETQVKNFNK